MAQNGINNTLNQGVIKPGTFANYKPFGGLTLPFGGQTGGQTPDTSKPFNQTPIQGVMKPPQAPALGSLANTQALTQKTNSLLGGNQFNNNTGASNQPLVPPPTQNNGDPNWQPQQGQSRDANGQTQYWDSGNWTVNNPNPASSYSSSPTPIPNQTYPGLVNRLGQTASTPTEGFNQSQGDAQKARQALMQSAPQENADVLAQKEKIQNLNTDYANQNANIMGGRTDLSEAGGEQGILQNLYAGKSQALNTGLQNILQSNAQQQAAFTGAGNLANTAGGIATGQQSTQQQGLGTVGGLMQPVQVPYSNQYINPVTGQPVGGGAISGSLQDAVSNVVEKLKSGQMSYNDATNALSGYGQGGINALQKALPPGFNIAQSNTLSGQQGSIGPAYSFAKSALTNLQNITQKLGSGTFGQMGLQGSNFPGGNSIGNWISTTFGANSDQTRQYMGAVQEARNAYAQLLAASRGGTPTDYGDQSKQAIPDNATPNDINAAINNLESLGQSKLNIYGNPGQSTTQTNAPTGTGIYNF